MRLLPLAGALSAGLIGALALFWTMQYLIAPREGINAPSAEHDLVDFIRIDRQETAAEQKKRRPPEPEPEPIPDMHTPAIASSPSTQPRLDVRADMPAAMHQGIGNGPKISLESLQRDSELVPLVRMPPQYPKHAVRVGIEGHVRARLTVDEEGRVKTVEIIESVPEGEFDRSAKRALARWKFNPKIVDGTAIEYSGTVTLEYHLNK